MGSFNKSLLLVFSSQLVLALIFINIPTQSHGIMYAGTPEGDYDYGDGPPVPPDPIVEPGFLFKKKESYVEVQGALWTSKSDLELTFDVTTRSFAGQVMDILVMKVDSNVKLFEVVLTVSQRALVGRVLAVKDQDVMETLGEVGLNKEISDGKRHHVTVRISGNYLYVDQDGTHRNVSLAPVIPAETYNAMVYLGNTDQKLITSFTGCLQNLTILSAGLPVDATAVHLKEAVDDRCTFGRLNCPKQHCAYQAPCIDYWDMVECDCLSVGREGPRCNQRPVIINFKESGQFLKYVIAADNDVLLSARRHPERIALAFKTKIDSEQVLLHAKMTSPDDSAFAGSLRVLLTGAKLVVQLADYDVAVFNGEFDDNAFHTLVLHLKYNEEIISAHVDGGTPEHHNWGASENLPSMQFHDAVYFAGNTQLAEGNEAPGFVGCMRSIFINFQSLLNKIKSGSTDVQPSPGMLYPQDFTCPDESEVFPVVPDVPEEVGVEEPPVLLVDGGEQHEHIHEPEHEDTEPAQEPPHVHNAEDAVDPQVEAEIDEYEDEPIVDPVGGTKTIDFDVACQELQCPMGCRPNAMGLAECNCADTGNVGQKCQFSTLPRSCAELFELGEHRSGIYKIDVDGNGPLAPTLAGCHEGRTSIDSSLPNNTLVRGSGMQDSQYMIEYRLFSPDQLKSLMQDSGVCTQFVKYNCNQAPIKLGEKTFFTSLNMDYKFGMLGGPDTGRCSCGDNCVASKSCNCDANAKGEYADEGLLTGRYAGVTSAIVLAEKSDVSGKLTVGPIVCSGIVGILSVVTLKNPDVPIELLGSKWEGTQLSFWIRPGSPDGQLLHIASSDGNRHFRITMSKEHIIEAAVSTIDSTPATVARVAHTTKLNDRNWHRVAVDVAHEQLLLQVDRQLEVVDVDGGSTLIGVEWGADTEIGGKDGSAIESAGYVGCVRGVVMNGKTVDLHSAVNAKVSDSVSVGCPDYCNPNPCVNGAECSNDYAGDTYKCTCANPWAHSGKHCDIDLNAGGEVTLKDDHASFLRFANLENNPISSQLLFSFRTDKHSGLLLYTHDYRYNFVQVTLLTQRTIQLTINYVQEIKECTIQRNEGEFSDMEWQQVVVRYTDSVTELIVDDLACIVDGKREISTEYIKDFQSAPGLESVFPPRIPIQSDDGTIAYSILFLGGVPKPNMDDVKKRRFKRQSTSSDRAFYFTNLKHLQGCFRGLTSGDQKVDLLDTLSHSSAGTISTGCDHGCDTITCDNGGHCAVHWLEDTPGQCDCAFTSYTGKFCNEEQGLQFDGGSALLFDAKMMAKNVLRRRGGTSHLSFAFSGYQNDPNKPKLLLLIMFKNNIQMEVYLDTTGYLEVRVDDPELGNTGDRFSGKYSDDYRHFIHLEFHPRRKEIFIKVDGMTNKLHTGMRSLRLQDALSIVVGGNTAEISSRRTASEFSNYVGCITNVVVGVDHMTYQPMTSYLNPDDVHHKLTSVIGASDTLISARCAAFAPAVIGGELQPPVATFPAWNPPFNVKAYERPKEESGGDQGGHSGGSDDQKEEGGGGRHPAEIVAIILGLIFIICAILGLIYVVYLRFREDKPIYTTAEDAFQPNSPKPYPNEGTYMKGMTTHEEKLPLKSNEYSNDPKPYSPSHSPYSGVENTFDNSESPHRPTSPGSNLPHNGAESLHHSPESGPNSNLSYTTPPRNHSPNHNPFSRPLSHFADEENRINNEYPPPEPLPHSPYSPNEFA